MSLSGNIENAVYVEFLERNSSLSKVKVIIKRFVSYNSIQGTNNPLQGSTGEIKLSKELVHGDKSVPND